MEDDAVDLAGFCVGVVEEGSLLGPDRVREGDAIVGLASSGLHANGYSLVRRALLPRFALDEVVPALGRALADELLEPCAIHAPDVLALRRAGLLHAAAHVTGGGVHENLPRALPDGLGATIRRGSWPEPPIFGLVAEAAGAGDDDLFRTFNMGLGMLLVVPPEALDEVLARGEGSSFLVGEVHRGSGVRVA
jgi:phosphoribosylformylglycinamidine cyclo-ligase